MKYKLLVAEDIPEERAALCDTLRKHLGDVFTILPAKDGREALALYRREKPGIAILNIEMPGCTGLEVARAIRETDRHCCIFFISDFDSFSYAQQAISLRAMDYILKPYDEAALIRSIRNVIQDPVQTELILPDHRHPSDALAQDLPDDPEGIRISLVRKDISAYIADHYTEELSMKNVAHAMNYSDAYFCKLFKQCFQVNFSTYLNEYRIEKARVLMQNPRINIKDISTACGFSDPNYFSRVFKRLTGQTPTEYRLFSLNQE